FLHHENTLLTATPPGILIQNLDQLQTPRGLVQRRIVEVFSGVGHPISFSLVVSEIGAGRSSVWYALKSLEEKKLVAKSCDGKYFGCFYLVRGVPTILLGKSEWRVFVRMADHLFSWFKGIYEDVLFDLRYTPGFKGLINRLKAEGVDPVGLVTFGLLREVAYPRLGRFLEKAFGMVKRREKRVGEQCFSNVMLFSDKNVANVFLGGDSCYYILSRLTMQGPLGVEKLLDVAGPPTKSMHKKFGRQEILDGLERLVLRGQVSKVKHPETGITLYRCETPFMPSIPIIRDRANPIFEKGKHVFRGHILEAVRNLVQEFGFKEIRRISRATGTKNPRVFLATVLNSALGGFAPGHNHESEEEKHWETLGIGEKPGVDPLNWLSSEWKVAIPL
ncbi:MAG: hypothetical protein DRO11_09450, partial [Methanobacteriota archaeon]